MHRFTATLLALGLSVAAGAASAQTWFDGNGRYDDSYQRSYERDYQGRQSSYEYARVLSVRPVVDNGYRNYPAASSPRCYERRDDYAAGYGDDPYGDRYARDGDYRDTYANDRYGRDDYYNRGHGTNAGRTVATVVGGIVGAAIGSQVGGGSARYATSAIGSMVGGIAGQQVYENSVRQRNARRGTVTVCDPVPDDRYHDGYGTRGSAVRAYDVTYEYAGREYTTRTDYHPGDRIRVLVDVRPQ